MQLLFHKEGFFYFIKNEANKNEKINSFKVSHSNQWETEILKEISTNLSLRRNFKTVSVAFASSFFNLVPKVYTQVAAESLLILSEAEFEENILLRSETQFESSFVYGTSQKLIDLVKKQYANVVLSHSGSLFLNHLEKSEQATLHLNLIQNQLEIVAINQGKLVFYNLFDTPTTEDILFFTLFTLEQLNWNSNKIQLKTYGHLLPETSGFQTLRKYIRHVHTAMKDEIYLENYTLFNLAK